MQRHQKLNAIIVHACSNCSAPGVYRHGDTEEEKARFALYPACWVEHDDIRKGERVGDICPNCQAERPRDEDLGVIWHAINGIREVAIEPVVPE